MSTKRIATSFVVLALALVTCAPATAQVTIGQLATSANAEECEYFFAADEIVINPAIGTGYAVPAPGGVITSWSTASFLSNLDQQIGFKVFRPSGPNTFTPLAQDNRTLAPNSLNTYSVSIPVQAGDLIGFHMPNESETGRVNCSFETPGISSKWTWFNGSAAVGASTPFTEEFDAEDLANVSAIVLPPPAISAIAAAKGSVKGGTSVVVSGANFARVTGVAVGANPATSFTVDSEGQITVVTPASKAIGKVAITVTTEAGSSTSATQFAYEGCKVPKLGGKKLKSAKKKLKKGDCKLGKVAKKGGATSKTGKVSKQSPKPGKVLAPGSKVKVTLKA